MPTRKLTLKEKAFIKETIATRNPSEAARRVYNIGSKGGSKTKKQAQMTAGAIAHENLNKPKIRKSINDYLPDDLIYGSLEDDIRGKPKFRVQELSLAAKIKGLLTDKVDITSNQQPITGFNYIKPQNNEDKPNNEAPQSPKSNNKPKDE